jgi:Phosphotransferase enzyme family
VSKGSAAVLRDAPRSHPAVAAWQGASPGGRAPTGIEVLRDRSLSTVYRLIEAGHDGASVIAKRYPRDQGAAERYVYEHILPRLSVSVPRCLGMRAVDGTGEEAGQWIFLEDVGTERYSDRDPEHLALVAHWIAQAHRQAAALNAAGRLPDGGPARYRAHVDAAYDRIGRRLDGGGLTAADRVVLRETLSVLEGLAASWSGLEVACVGLAPTLVHGDFRPKNVYLRRWNGRLACYPIDWETAGWGVPAVDLTRIDGDAYWDVAREWQVGVEPFHVRRLARLGHVFRTIAAIDWESTGLAYESRHMISRPLASLGVLLRQLRDAVAGVEIEP